MTYGGTEMKFEYGHLVATPGALKAFEDSKENSLHYIVRHLNGDWGDLCEEDKLANDIAITEGTRLLSAYTLKTGVKLWIITEADRSVTTLLLPEEY